MLGSVRNVLLRLRISALAVSIGVVGMAACASSENATFDEPGGAGGGDVDAGLTDAKSDATPDTDSGSDGGEGGAGGSGGTGGSGGSGGTGGSNEPDTCGLSTCPEPDYPEFEKCCTNENTCGYRNGPSGYCYAAASDDPPPGAGGGP